MHVGYLHALSSSLLHCHSRAQRIANILCCQVQCYIVVTLSALGQYNLNVFMMRCVAKLLLNMSRRRKSHTLSSTSPARRCQQPASRAELLLLLLAHSLCRAVSGVSMGITYTHHCRHTYFCVSVRTAFNWFASVRRAGESRLSQCRMTAATGTGQWALGPGSRVTVTGHRPTST